LACAFEKHLQYNVYFRGIAAAPEGLSKMHVVTNYVQKYG
jgi:hypothetical protein